MKKLILLLCTLGALAVPAVSQAYVHIGPCLLRAQVPVALNPRIGFEGYPDGEGQINDCINQDANYSMGLETCIQVLQSAGWATKQETCVNDWPSQKLAGINEFAVAYNFGSPRTYRTWVYGCASGTCKSYVSGTAQW